jgi:hypothetical protein
MDSLLVYKRADSLILADIYTATNGTLNAVDGWGAVNYGVMTNNTMKTQIVDAAGDAVSVSTGQLDVRAAQVGTWSVTAAVDSSSQRVTHKISQMPTVSIDSSTTRNTMKVLNTVATSLDSSTQRSTIKISSMPSTTASATVIYDSTVTATSMTITALNSLANSATAGWKSDTIDLRARKCSDVKFGIKVTMANTAPANDKAVYVYAIPWWYDGSSWYSASGGTTTLPTGGQAAYTIASPNNFRLLGVLSYTTQNMVLQDQFLLSNAFGNVMPDMVQIFVLNYSGAAVHSSGQALYYSPTYKTQR